MIRKGFTKEERSKLIKRSFQKEARDYFFNNVPVVAMGQCPYCDEVLYRTFDPYGLESLWWMQAYTEEYEPEPCEHFYLLCGAVNFNGKPVSRITADNKVIPGPEAPYVYLKELKPEGRSAVVCQLDMECGYTAYSIAYFSKNQKKTGWFSTKWKNDHEIFVEEDGSDGWGEAKYDWDFDLMYWLKKGKLKWCDPGSGNEKLSENSIEESPFVDLPGKQEILIITGEWVGDNNLHYMRNLHRFKDDRESTGLNNEY